MLKTLTEGTHWSATQRARAGLFKTDGWGPPVRFLLFKQTGTRPMDQDLTAQDARVAGDQTRAALRLRRRRGGRCAHLGAREGVRTVQRDGGDAGKCLGRPTRAGEAPCDGDELLLLRGSAPTPASDWRRSWTGTRGKKGAGERGEQGEEVESRGERRGEAARPGRGRRLPRVR